MTIVGDAEATVVPDQADLGLGVRQERKTIDAATQATVEAATALIALAKARGVAPADIHTSFTITQVFEPKKDDKDHVVGQTLRGYVADEKIEVRVHDISNVGLLARDLLANGASTFERIGFTYSKARQKRRELDAEAMRDALAKAGIYTNAVGLKLGRVLQIGDETPTGGEEADLPARRATTGYGGPMQMPIPIEPGLQTLRETVTVIWEIEGVAR